MMKLTAISMAVAVGLVMAFGVYLLTVGLRNVAWGVASSHWPTAVGKVLGSSTKESRNVDEDTGDVSLTYSAETSIAYSVNGKEYSTKRIHFGQALGSGDVSEAELQRVRYPEGRELTICYNPSQPEIAAARPGLHGEAFWLPGAGLAFLIPAVIALLIFVPMFRGMSQVDSEGDTIRRSVEDSMAMMQRGIIPPDVAFKPPKDSSDTIMPVVVSLFAAVFCGLGILALSSGLQRFWQGNASQSWPAVEGKVLFSRVNASESRDSDHARTTSFSPQFVYEYVVDGAKHFNNRRRFGRIEGSSEDWAKDIAGRYEKGRTVLVHYYPADPDVAVLEPGNNSEGLWLPGVGLVALLFGLATLKWIVPVMGK